MDDTWLQQATVDSFTPCRESTIFVENFVADDVIFWISLPEAEITSHQSLAVL